MTPEDFKELVRKLRSDDPRERSEAIQNTWQEYGSRMRAVAFGIIRDWQQAEDVVQEAMLRLTHLAIGDFDSDGLLFSDLRYLCLTKLRKMRRDATISLDAIGFRSAEGDKQQYDLPDHKQAGPEEQVIKREASRTLREHVEQLAPKLREVLELSFSEDLTYQQIAEHLRVSVKTVQNRMSRAKEKLRYKISRDREPPERTS